MAVAFEAKGSAAVDVNAPVGANIDFTNLSVPPGENRVLAVIVTYSNSGAVSQGITATWDQGGTNQAVTLIGEGSMSTGGFIRLFGLVAPTVGNNLTLRIATTAGCDGHVTVDAMCFTGASQVGGTSTFRNFNSATSTSATASITVASSNDDLVVAGQAGTAVNVDSTNNTNIFINNTGFGKSANYAVGAAAVTMSATLASSAVWVAAGFSIKAVSSPNLFGTLVANGTGALSGPNINASNNISINGGTGVAVSVGDLVVVLMAEQGALTATACVDNISNYTTAYATTLNSSGTTVSYKAFYRRVDVAGTLTDVRIAATNSNDDFACVAAVFHGPFANPPIDVNPANGTADITTPFVCPSSGALAQNNELVLSLAAHNANAAWSVTTPSLLAVNSNRANAAAIIGYRVVSTTAAIAPEFSGTNPANTNLGVASFRRSEPMLDALPGNLELSTTAPTRTVPKTPARVDLELSTTAPTVRVPVILICAQGGLALSTAAAIVTVGPARLPASADLAFSVTAPTILTTRALKLGANVNASPLILSRRRVASRIVGGFIPSAPAGAINRSPAASDLSLTLAAPSLNLTLSPPAGDLSLSASAPVVSEAAVLAPPSTDLSLSSAVPTLAERFALSPAHIDLALSVAAPGLTRIEVLSPPAADATLSALAPSLAEQLVLQPAHADLALGGTAPSLAERLVLQPAAADLALTGTAPIMTAFAALSPPAIDLALSADPPILTLIEVLSPSPADIALSALAPAIAEQFVLRPSPTDLALDGTAPTVTAFATLSPSAADLALSTAEPLLTERWAVAPTAADLSLSSSAPTVEGAQPQQLTAACSSTVTSLLVRGGRQFTPPMSVAAVVEVTVALEFSPPAAQLALTSTAPSISGVDLVPAGADLALSASAPLAGLILTAQPAAVDLVLSTSAPNLNANIGLSPDAANLSLSTIAPVASLRYAAQPAAADLSLTTTAPAAQTILRPAAADLSLSAVVPSVLFRYTAQPPSADLTLSTMPPNLGGNVGVSPDVADLALSGSAPALATRVSVPHADLVLSTAGPAVGLELRPAAANLVASAVAGALRRDATVYPAAADLAITSVAGALQLGLVAARAGLALSTAAPSLATRGALTPASANLAFSSIPPTLGGNLIVAPDTVDLTLSTVAPSLRITLQPARTDLSLSVTAPSRATGPNRLPAAADLALSATAPTLKITEGRVPAGADIAVSSSAPAAQTRFVDVVPQANVALSTSAPILIRRLSPGAAQISKSTSAPTIKFGASLYPAHADLLLDGVSPFKLISGDAFCIVPAGDIGLDASAPILFGHPPRSATLGRLRGRQRSYVRTNAAIAGRKNAATGRRPAASG